MSRHDEPQRKVGVGADFDRGAELRPMYLETADIRIHPIRARNINLWLAGLSVVATFIAAVWLLARGLSAGSEL